MSAIDSIPVWSPLPDSVTGNRNVKGGDSDFGFIRHDVVVQTFGAWFKELLRGETYRSFAARTNTGAGTISRAITGEDIATSCLERWAAALPLDSNEAKRFIEMGRKEEAENDKKRGDLYREADASKKALITAEKSLEQLRSSVSILLTILEKDSNHLSKSAIKAIRLVRKSL